MQAAEYRPTPEGKQWLDSLGPEVLNLALSLDAQSITQSDVDFKCWQIAEIVRKWAKNRPHQIMEVNRCTQPN